MLTDIEKMYRQILVKAEDHKFQCILWKSNRNAPINMYELNIITYDIISVSFLAIWEIGIEIGNSISQNFSKEQANYNERFLCRWSTNGETSIEMAGDFGYFINQISSTKVGFQLFNSQLILITLSFRNNGQKRS